jgi:hypothetical protein
MTSRGTKSFVTIAVAVAITALIVGVSTFLVVSPGSTTVTVTSAVMPSGGRLYEVAFKQSGACTPTAYAAPWSVMLGSWTVAEPSNASLPIETSTGFAGPSDANYSMIAFSVPNGQYQYKVTAAWGFGNSTGVVNVKGADVTVLLEGPYITCTMSTATQTNTVSSVSGANGLTFQLTMNLSDSSSGVTVDAVAGDYNLHASPANVTATDAWAVPNQVLQSRFCIPADNPVGISIAQGHYTLSNVSSAEFLIFINPTVTYTCTVRAPSPVATYSFGSMGDVAVARGSCGSSTCGYNTTVSDQLVASGSYVGGALSGFAPGEYTVVAGDEWGNSLFAYFTVP